MRRGLVSGLLLLLPAIAAAEEPEAVGTTIVGRSSSRPAGPGIGRIGGSRRAMDSV